MAISWIQRLVAFQRHSAESNRSFFDLQLRLWNNCAVNGWEGCGASVNICRMTDCFATAAAAAAESID